jgi:nicotinamidase-related amidase
MSENPNPITIENSVVILIDHQPWVAFSVQSIDTTLLVNNVTGLATVARDLGVPTVLTTVGASGGPLNDHNSPSSARCFLTRSPLTVSRRTRGKTSSPPSRPPVGKCS